MSDQEAVARYQQVAPQLSPDAYRQSAEEEFARMSPPERQQFGQYLRQRAQQQRVDIQGPPEALICPRRRLDVEDLTVWRRGAAVWRGRQ